ncbi:helix-turn-helix transcriptional regulator [Acetoanaerobium pronyense]|uniref:helix-turn-helix transcriptional regulator n=1 Tax=Acetoanaerobium pronyense TaxID=1482736 RepID=UPI002ED50B45
MCEVRLHRLLGILLLLDSRGTMTAKNLASILETSERTIYRDIDILCESGVPIYAHSGPKGGYSVMNDFKINFNVLEFKDAFHLLLSGMGIYPDKNSEMSQHLKNALIKLENSVSEEHQAEIIKAKEKFFVDSQPWWGEGEDYSNLDIIKNAILNLNKIKIYYKKFNNETSERVLRPYGAVVKDSKWYLIGLCEMKNEIRVFMFKRILKVDVMDEKFTMPTDFSLENFWEDSKKHFKKTATGASKPPTYLVRLKSPEPLPETLRGFDEVFKEKINKATIYCIDMISFQTAISILFPLSDSIEVLEPDYLREYIKKKAEKIINLYLNS